MQKNFIILLFVTSMSVACGYASNEKINQKDEVSEITKSYMTFWTYWNKEINLCSDFIAKDTSSNTLTKKRFTELLNTGNYIPIASFEADSLRVYQLFHLPEKVDENINETIKQMAKIELDHLKLEGKKMPQFHFTDINGTLITDSTFNENFIVAKTWFIKCGPCEKQLPHLNKIMDKYNTKNVRFISFADDEKDLLKEYRDLNELQFLIIPKQADYIRNTLGLQLYPSYILIDPNGIVLKVADNLDVIDDELEAHSDKLSFVPPPPAG
ncbi:TlpA family protein disulfide reductase [Phnomibacter ginsenosidimutans]|uniref:Redoxin domain-containing protein n=1 Tax=Phnomibacter ginsenosidimutans TaxID=2676868 RepID=A0A6I6GLW0_9BACT|nr:TlpA disulfide reductase family protein [Phnomibacter ginsenosidimutans]QGW29475.1 redoxin domain-containing protein [Phnomibacter ginsenosidimutans]